MKILKFQYKKPEEETCPTMNFKEKKKKKEIFCIVRFFLPKPYTKHKIITMVR